MSMLCSALLLRDESPATHKTQIGMKKLFRWIKEKLISSGWSMRRRSRTLRGLSSESLSTSMAPLSGQWPSQQQGMPGSVEQVQNSQKTMEKWSLITQLQRISTRTEKLASKMNDSAIYIDGSELGGEDSYRYSSMSFDQICKQDTSLRACCTMTMNDDQWHLRTSTWHDLMTPLIGWGDGMTWWLKAPWLPGAPSLVTAEAARKCPCPEHMNSTDLPLLAAVDPWRRYFTVCNLILCNKEQYRVL